MQKHVDQHKLWAHSLAIYDSSVFAFSMRTSRSKFDVLMLAGTPVLNVFAFIQKVPKVIGDDISKLDNHLAQTPMRPTSMGVDPKTK